MLRLLENRQVRGWLIQGVVVALIGFAALSAAGNLRGHAASSGGATGFDFLEQPAGFDIAMSLVPYAAGDTYARVLIVSALNTLLVSALGIIVATFIGLIAGVLRLSAHPIMSRLAALYVETARNIPLLLQIFLFYGLVLALPRVNESVEFAGIVLNNRGLYLPRLIVNGAAENVLFIAAGGFGFSILACVIARARLGVLGLLAAAIVAGIVAISNGAIWQWELPHREAFNFAGGMRVLPSLVALWAALSVYTGAFISEIVRAGINSVPLGQKEAGEALGLRAMTVLSRIIMPQALRVIVPPLTNQYLNLLKNSSLAVAIGYPDIVQVFLGTALNQTGRAIEIILITMGFYLAISLALAVLMNIYNRVVALRGVR